MSTLNLNPDYFEENENKPLLLNLYSEWDDEEELPIKQKLEALVNGEITPTDLALDLDNHITSNNTRQHAQMMKRPEPWRCTLTPDEESRGVSIYRLAPNPEPEIDTIYETTARLCAAFPPYHAGQNLIIEILEALRDLPRHEVYLFSSHNPERPFPMMTLWPIQGCLAGPFERELPACYPPYRWRNINSAMARLTTLGLFDCSWLSSLFDILPSSGEYPDLERRPIDGPNKLGNYMLGAAQWVIRPDECRYVYRRCQEEEGAGERRVQWSMGHWREWKRQFGFVAGDERFAEKYRNLARQAYLQMTACEEGG